jgi:hypothetical protein
MVQSVTILCEVLRAIGHYTGSSVSAAINRKTLPDFCGDFSPVEFVEGV